MSRVHDMGGRFGDGPVDPEDNAKFAEDWHRLAMALTLTGGTLGLWSLDTSRHAREGLPPKDYNRFTYYEKWIAALTNLLVESGAITLDELRGAEPAPSPLAEKALTPEALPDVLAKGGPADRPSDVVATFAVGVAVRTRMAANTLVDGGHTRLPRYASKAKGRIVMVHGTHILPDSNAHRLGEAPEPLYAVAFPASELWQSPEHPRDEVVLDLWQSYLEPA